MAEVSRGHISLCGAKGRTCHERIEDYYIYDWWDRSLARGLVTEVGPEVRRL